LSDSFAVVDLFAGPGGLAEGFSAYTANNKSVFKIHLSVEKEASAFATLRLRSFTRQFDGQLPSEYYEYISGQLSLEQVAAAYPAEWALACGETRQLELGTVAAAAELDPILDAIRDAHEGRTVLIGGPPCQAYSLVGRARNRGIRDYNPADDHRHFLYREYIRIINRLHPAVFVMENVKGFLSSAIDGHRIFDHVLRDLGTAGGTPESYRVIPLVASDESGGREFIVRSEQFGVPQARHRVILCGLRQDVATELPDNIRLLSPERSAPTVAQVLGAMPRLRSGLSKTTDTPEGWKSAVLGAYRTAAAAASSQQTGTGISISEKLNAYSKALGENVEQWPRRSNRTAPVSNNALAAWLIDPALQVLPNHETRGHMEADLTRYAFATAFSEVTGRSPNASDFPPELAPAHANWTTGKFADRFRVQCWGAPATTVTSHIAKDGHYFIHPDTLQCRSLTVREAARLQTFPDNYFFEGNRTQQFVQVGNAVPPLLAQKIAAAVHRILSVQNQLDQEERSAESIAA
jgi:DNA (cytosine-5)-methyltransferase 1